MNGDKQNCADGFGPPSARLLQGRWCKFLLLVGQQDEHVQENMDKRLGQQGVVAGGSRLHCGAWRGEADARGNVHVLAGKSPRAERSAVVTRRK